MINCFSMSGVVPGVLFYSGLWMQWRVKLPKRSLVTFVSVDTFIFRVNIHLYDKAGGCVAATSSTLGWDRRIRFEVKQNGFFIVACRL